MAEQEEEQTPQDRILIDVINQRDHYKYLAIKLATVMLDHTQPYSEAVKVAQQILNPEVKS